LPLKVTNEIKEIWIEIEIEKLPTQKAANLEYKYKLHFQAMDENTMMLTWNIDSSEPI